MQSHPCALARPGSDFKPPACQPHPLADSFQTISRSVSLSRLDPGESLAVVFNFNVKSSGGEFEPDPNLPRARVFKHIVDGLLRREEEMMPQLVWQFYVWNLSRKLKSTLHFTAFKEILHEPAKVMQEVRQGVIFRVDRPDDFLQ